MSLTVARSLRSTVYGGDFGLSHFFYNSEVGGVIDLAPLDTSWRRNLLTYTDDFANAVWNKTSVSVVSNSVAGPLPDTLADTMEATATTIPYFSQLIPIEAGKVYTFSGYFKKKDVTTVSLLIYGTDFNSGGGNLGADFNLDTGTITSQNTSGAAMTNLGGGWYRCSVTHTATTTKSAAWQLCRYGGASTTIGFGTYLFGAQAEPAATPSAYQPITDFHTEVRAMHPGATLYQDTAGLQPVTAPGQTVALARVKPYGIDFTQSSASLRPTYAVRPKGGRRNLLTYTEEFSNAVWAKLQSTVGANAIAAPDGTLTADKLIEDATTNVHTFQQSFTVLATKTYTRSVYLKAAERGFAFFGVNGTGLIHFATVNLSTGAISTGTGSPVNMVSSNEGNGWWRCSFQFTVGGTDVSAAHDIRSSIDGVWANRSYLGDGTSGLYVWGAMLNEGGLIPYQRVTSMFDVYEAGKTHYGALWFDGVDDFMVSDTVTPGTDKVQVFAGVKRLAASGSARVLLESSVNYSTNNGTIVIFEPPGLGNGPLFGSKGTVFSEARGNVGQDISYAMVSYGDIAADALGVRINAAAAVTSATDQGTGNYLAYPIYLGRRGGTSNPFNGEIEALIGYRFGPNLSDTQLSQISNFINSRTGAF